VVYNVTKNAIESHILKKRIKIAKEQRTQSKHQDKKTKLKVKRYRMAEDDMNDVYRMNMLAACSDAMCDSEIIMKKIKTSQNYDLMPSYIYSLASATHHCSGLLPEDRIVYRGK
jgi:hypothetical protein